MRVLLDEGVNRKIATALGRFSVVILKQAGWLGASNGELLRRMRGKYDVLIAHDIGLTSERAIAAAGVCVLLVRGRSNRPVDILPLIPEIRRALLGARPGRRIVVGGSPRRR
jgi:hypothetical protein